MERSEPLATVSSPASTSGDRVLSHVVALTCVGAGAVHLAFTPVHFDHGAGPGTYFVALAWVQIACGAALVARRRRALLTAALAVNVIAIAVWIAARASGNGDLVEPFRLADTLAVMLQVATVVGIPLQLTGWITRRQIRVRSAQTSIAIVVVALVALTSASLTAALPAKFRDREVVRDRVVTKVRTQVIHIRHNGGGTASGHAHDAGGATATSASHQHTTTTSDTTQQLAAHNHTPDTVTVLSSEQHDHGGGTTSTTVAGSHDHGGTGGTTAAADWELTRRAALLGNLDAATRAARTASIRSYLATQIRQRSALIRSLAPDEATRRVNAYVDWTLTHALDVQHGAEGGNHTSGPQLWQTMDAATTARLQAQLKVSATVIARYPTAADAMAAGYFQVTPWMWGIGAHYLNISYIFSFDPAHPSILLYNGNSASSEIVGVSYAVIGSQAPEGFAGPNDTWHTHPALCILGGTFVVGADNTPADVCASIGGVKSNGFGGIQFWMMHLWQAPGWESWWGLFSPESPAVNLETTDIR